MLQAGRAALLALLHGLPAPEPSSHTQTHTHTLSLAAAHTSLSPPLRAASLACCRLIGEDVWPVTASLSRGLWQVGHKICQTLNLDCNLTVTITPRGTVQELGLQEVAHIEGECSGGMQ